MRIPSLSTPWSRHSKSVIRARDSSIAVTAAYSVSIRYGELLAQAVMEAFVESREAARQRSDQDGDWSLHHGDSSARVTIGDA